MRKRAILFSCFVLCLFIKAFAWNAPTVTSPSSGASMWAGESFDWTTVINSEAYQFQVDTSANFDSPILVDLIKPYLTNFSGNSDTRQSLSTLLFGSTVYWRVRAFIPNDTSVWTTSTATVRDFVTTVGPNNTDEWQGVELDWLPHLGISQYLWEADTTPNFNSPIFQQGANNYINSVTTNTDTEHFLDNTIFGAIYYWRVRVTNAADTSEYSVVNSFTVRDFVTLVSPNNTSEWQGVELDWLPHIGVSQYLWEADTSQSFNSPVFQTGANNYINSVTSNTDTEHFLDNTIFGATYYWRVRVTNAADTSEYSVVNSFTVRDFVTLVSPNNTNEWQGVELDWLPHIGVSQYLWEADTSQNFNSPVFQTGADNYINSVSSNTDTEHFLDNTIFGATYYWRVRATNTADTSEYSVVNSFTVRDFVTLVSPSNTDEWQGVELDWLPHIGVSQYLWEADTSQNFNSPVFQTGADNYINSVSSNQDTEHFLDNTIFGATYYWRVRATNTVDTSEYSVVNTFNVRDFVTLVNPNNTDEWQGVELDWNAHDGVERYYWQLDTSLNFNSGAFQEGSSAYINSVNSNNDTEVDVSNTVFGATYYWRVRVSNTVDTSEWSNPFSYTVRDFVNLNSPADNSTNVSLTSRLDWNAHTGVTFYEVHLDSSGLYNSPGFERGINNYINSVSSNSDTRYTPSNLAANTAYFWKVRAINAIDTSAWTERRFTTGNAPLPTLGVPTLISPNNGATFQPTSITLDWSAVTGISSYYYEVDDNLSFTSPISGTVGVDEVSLTLNANKTYYWRVRSVDGGNVSAWSSTWRFDTDIPTNSITTNNPTTTGFCQGDVISISYNASGVFTMGNVFTAELSDATGSFASPTVIGSVSGINPAAISGTLPNNASGSNYLVRVNSSQPAITGSASPSGFSIIAPPSVVSVSNTSPICEGETLSLNATLPSGASATWLYNNSPVSINNPYTQTNVSLVDAGSYGVYATLNGCAGDTTQVVVSINPTPIATTGSNSPVCNGSALNLNATTVTGATYQWSGPNNYTSTMQNPTVSPVASPSLAGDYTLTVSVAGCTDTDLTTVTVGDTVLSNISNTICEGGSVAGYTSTGVYVDVFTGPNGCDSTVVLDLTVLDSSLTNITTSICTGQSFAGYTSTGVYSDVYTAANGCDSTVVIALTVQTNITTTVNQSICQGDVFEGYSTSGSYVDQFTAQGGCDSTRTLNLTVLDTAFASISQSICEGQSFEGYCATGIYRDVFQAANGCDSIRVLDLLVIDTVLTTINKSICEGESFEGYTLSGSYTDVFTGSNNCDSTRILNLTVNTTSTTSLMTDILVGDSLFVGGAFQTTAGTYVDSFTNTVGCDSIVTTELQVLVGIETINSSTVKVYPNPASGSFMVQLDELAEDTELRLYNTIGEEVMNTKLAQVQQSIPLGELASGLYYIRISSSKGLHQQALVIE